MVMTRPGSLPLIGHYLDYRRAPLEFWTETGRMGPVVRVRFGVQEFWVVTDSDLVAHNRRCM